MIMLIRRKGSAEHLQGAQRSLDHGRKVRGRRRKGWSWKVGGKRKGPANLAEGVLGRHLEQFRRGRRR